MGEQEVAPGMFMACGPGAGSWTSAPSPYAAPPKQRAIYLRVDQVRLLDHWCESLRATFGREVWLVGSVLRHAGWRDVDVRIALHDKELKWLPLNRLDLNMLLSQWGQRATGLPIDCQVQSRSEFENEDGMANPRGYITADHIVSMEREA